MKHKDMLQVLILIMIFVLIISVVIKVNIRFTKSTDKTVNSILELIEKAYFEGQVDALEGDIRVKLNADSCYIWSKSPWDDGIKPVYNPNSN